MTIGQGSGGQADAHLEMNRAYWTSETPRYAEIALRNWDDQEISWGIWGTMESDLQVLGEVEGLDVLELGCGTANFSAWLARRGARPVGLDLTPAQLATARAMQSRFGLAFPLVEATAERVPLRDQSFDLALSQYGASIWCDPYRWIRLLRANGFEIDNLVEIQAPAGASSPYEVVLAGAHRWPSEEIWVARRRGPDGSRRPLSAQ